MLADKELFSYKAGADLSAAGSLVVTPGTVAGEVVTTAAGTNRPVGVIDQDGGATSGHAVRVVMQGRVKAKAGGALAVNTIVAGGAGGKLIAAASTHFPVGVTEEAAAADGDLVTVFVSPSLIAKA